MRRKASWPHLANLSSSFSSCVASAKWSIPSWVARPNLVAACLVLMFPMFASQHKRLPAKIQVGRRVLQP